MNQKPDIEKLFNHWISSADKDFQTMIHLFESKDYHWALFIGHIVLEKLIKASIVKKTNDHSPFSHDLSKLASLSGLPFTEEQLDWLDTVTTFNMNARYDSYKQAFYLKCTHGFTNLWLDRIKELRLWIKEKL
jgi:HEPN domain-containing protein